MHQVLEKITNELFFKWPNKRAGNPMGCNQSLYCQYHQNQRHTTEDCRNLWDHLDTPWRDASLRPPLGTINVNFAALGRTDFCPSRVMSMAWLSTKDKAEEG